MIQDSNFMLPGIAGDSFFIKNKNGCKMAWVGSKANGGMLQIDGDMLQPSIFRHFQRHFAIRLGSRHTLQQIPVRSTMDR